MTTLNKDVAAPVSIKASSPYAHFATDKAAEKQGVVVDYGDFWFRVARTGGANTSYTKRLTSVFKPYRRAIQTDTMKDELAEKLMREVFAEKAVIGCGSTAFGDGFMPDANGERMEMTEANLVQMFTDLPDLFKDLQEQAGKVSLYRLLEAEEDAKN
jgi:hypothetical protein